MLVKDIMTKDIYTINHRATLRDVAYLLAVHGVGGLPVTDDSGFLVGIITENEIYKPKVQMEMDNDLLLGSLLNLRNPQRFVSELAESADLPVVSAMIANPLTVLDTSLINDTIRLFYENNIELLPVLDSKGFLTGIINKSDISRVLEK